jgi:hypothetical protein
MTRRLFFTTLALFAVISNAAQAASNLQKELGVVAKEVAKFLKDQDEQAVAVGEITAPPQLAASSGPGIQQILAEELKKSGIDVKARARLGIEGKYRDVVDEKTKRLAAQIQLSLVDRAGKVLVSFDRGVFGDATLASLFGATVELPPNADDKTRDRTLQDSLDKSRTTLAGPRISPSPGSPYGIEILVKSGGDFHPRPARDDDGLAYVPIKRDEIYAIRICNDSPHETAVTLSIDGLNVFTFSENKSYTQWIIPPKSKSVIYGWHVTNEKTDSFQVMEYARSAVAERLPNSSSVGTITASFAAAWAKGSPPPPDEPNAPNEFARSADATGRGPEVTTKYKEVERAFGVTRAAVSARYTK